MRPFLALFAVLLPALDAQTCAVPQQVPSTRPTRVDYKNTNLATDYYGLSLSWSPQYCNQNQDNPRARWQCVENSFGFVVHGLWPQSARARSGSEHPRNCKPPEILSAAQIRPYLCTMPGAQLIQDEWIKHGTCAFPNAKAYLDRTKELSDALVKPELNNLPGRPKAGDIRKAFAKANAAKGLKPEHIEIRAANRSRFTELMVCYDKQFKFTACKSPGTPDNIELSIAKKR
jgi:ribonuclease T2